MKKTKVISVITATAIIISLATALSAQAFSKGVAKSGDSNGKGCAMSSNKGQDVKKSAETVASRLSGLVTAGTITQSQADAIKSAIESAAAKTQKSDQNSNPRGAANGPLNDLVIAGTITQEQANAVMKAIMEAMKENKGTFDVSTVLSSLVTAGTITADQATAIKAALPGAAAQDKRNDKPGERKGETMNPLNGLVTAGTITQDQANAVMKAIMEAMKESKGTFDVSTVLSSLVTAGTITADQKTAILTAMENKTANQNSNQKQNHCEMNDKSNGGIKAVLDSLVTSGTITQDQETAVIKALCNK